LNENVSFRWLDYVERSADHKDDGGNEHQQSRHTEGKGVASAIGRIKAHNVSLQDGCDDGGDESADVDGQVENGEKGLQLSLLFRQLELIPSEGSYARFDTARPNGNQRKSDHRQLSLRRIDRSDAGDGLEEVAKDVNEGNVDDRLELPQEAV